MAEIFHPCTIKMPTLLQAEKARKIAQAETPYRTIVAVERLTVDSSAWWGDKPMKLKVAFKNGTPRALRDRVMLHANAWQDHCNKEFVESSDQPDIRVAFGPGGYYSYLGNQCRGIPQNQHTMNLEGFNSKSSEEEYRRVVRHEFGHALGCVHEHMRGELVARLDVQKTRRYFKQTQGWSANEVDQQVLTPLDKRSIFGTDFADEDSIMCYQLPGNITKDGAPIKGGSDINANDAAFIALLYPKPGPVLPPIGEGGSVEFVLGGERYRITKVGAA
jgi:hypothetical protein